MTTPPKDKTAARGYGAAHQRARRQALAELRAGGVGTCARKCGVPIYPTDELELDHDDNDRTKYIGLSHAECNRKAGGEKSRHRGEQTSEFGFWFRGQWNPTSRDW